MLALGDPDVAAAPSADISEKRLGKEGGLKPYCGKSPVLGEGVCTLKVGTVECRRHVLHKGLKRWL